MTLQQHCLRPVPPNERPDAEDACDDIDAAAAALFDRLGDPATAAPERRQLRDQIIRLVLPFASRLARRYRDRGQDPQDLEQVAALALVKAVDNFDPARGSPFFGYLVPTVLGELKRHFRDKGWDVHVSRRLQERHLELSRTAEALTHRVGRPPAVAELALALGITEEQVREAQLAGAVYDVDSLNATVSAREASCERGDLVGVEDRALESAADRLALRGLLRRLSPRDKFIVGQYFFADASQEQIATALGMSQMNVSRLLRRALQWLRGELDGDGTPPQPAANRTRTSGTGPGTVVVAAQGDLDEAGAVSLRAALVDAAVRYRPKRIVVDLRHAGTVGRHAVRALMDGYRACGHSGTVLVVVNVPQPLQEMLRRLGVVRLFACHPARSDPHGTDTASTVQRRATSCLQPATRPGHAEHRRRRSPRTTCGGVPVGPVTALRRPVTTGPPVGYAPRVHRLPTPSPGVRRWQPMRGSVGRRPRAP